MDGYPTRRHSVPNGFKKSRKFADEFGHFVTFVYRQFEILKDEDCTEERLKAIVRDVLRQIAPYS